MTILLIKPIVFWQNINDIHDFSDFSLREPTCHLCHFTTCEPKLISRPIFNTYSSRAVDVAQYYRAFFGSEALKKQQTVSGFSEISVPGALNELIQCRFQIIIVRVFQKSCKVQQIMWFWEWCSVVFKNRTILANFVYTLIESKKHT